MKQLDPVLLLLAAMMIFFTAALFICAVLLKTDGQTFQVISSLLTGISGAFLENHAQERAPGRNHHH